jgi:hypothetical protein
MSELAGAHRGYEYQDLVVALRLVDVLLDRVSWARVDQKLVTDNRFDDLTTEDSANDRERTQVKHTDTTIAH